MPRRPTGSLAMTIVNFASPTLGGQHFEQVPVRVPKIKSAAAVPVIDLHVLRGARAAAIGEALGANPVENPVELRLADLKGVMVAFEAVPIVEIDRQGVVDAHRSEMETGPWYSRPNIREKNRADSSLSRAGTIVWSRTMVKNASSFDLQ